MKIDKKALRQLALDEIARDHSLSLVVSEKATLEAVPFGKRVLSLELPPPIYTRYITRASRPRSSENSSASSVKEKFENLDSVPNKAQGRFPRLHRNLRHRVFSLYRRLFGIVFVVNLAILIFYAIQGVSVVKLGEIVIANLLVSISMREGRVVNAFFVLCCSVPTS